MNICGAFPYRLHELTVIRQFYAIVKQVYPERP